MAFSFGTSKYDIWASNLLFLSGLISLPFNFLTQEGFFIRNMSTAGLVILVGLTVLVCGLYYCVRRGQRWAKYTFLALYGLTLGFALLGSKSLADTHFKTWLHGANYLIQTTLEITAWVLIVLGLRQNHRSQLAELPYPFTIRKQKAG